ncbi:Uncharacterised protein [Bordetella ansorpii]|uniref:Uncharacterized protein n=1 Tax=Bordetella ansorpii TaxID=288768 RepID=A0A157RI94_9BORD|nr:Uncharacterised protein [Bordetella ansorpii]
MRCWKRCARPCINPRPERRRPIPVAAVPGKPACFRRVRDGGIIVTSDACLGCGGSPQPGPIGPTSPRTPNRFPPLQCRGAIGFAAVPGLADQTGDADSVACKTGVGSNRVRGKTALVVLKTTKNRQGKPAPSSACKVRPHPGHACHALGHGPVEPAWQGLAAIQFIAVVLPASLGVLLRAGLSGRGQCTAFRRVRGHHAASPQAWGREIRATSTTGSS